MKRHSHPLRAQVVKLIMRGEVTPAEVRQALQVSRQLIYYWCRHAGIAGKSKTARKTYVWRALLKGLPRSEGAAPEHPDVAMLRHRVISPRPTREQLAAAKGKSHAAKSEGIRSPDR